MVGLAITDRDIVLVGIAVNPNVFDRILCALPQPVF